LNTVLVGVDEANLDARHLDGGAPDQVTETLLDMRRTLSDVVARAIGPHSTCALLMFRDCNNFGDAAIWLGALQLLEELAVDVRYSQPLYRLHPDTLRKAVGDGPVLINGGGGFGDIYQKTQRFAYQIIESFRDRPVVLLPQTVFFRRPEALDEAKRVLGGHPDLTFICRDHVSFDVAKSAFDCDVELAPDLATALGPQRPVRLPSQRALWLLRRDKEAQVLEDSGFDPNVVTRDWEDVLESDARLRYRLRLEELLYRGMRRVARVVPQAHSGAAFPIASAKRLSATRVHAANALLSPAQCIVTDRLHAHLLAVLLGRSTIVCDNTFGKVRSFYETWTEQLPTTAWASSAREIEAGLERLVPR
jgi:exopolysaccharide biosynthesis predicted pyruvyltransferase EpsI